VRALRELRRDGRKRQARLDHDSGEIEGLQLWRGLPPVLTLNAHGGREGQRLCFFWLSGLRTQEGPEAIPRFPPRIIEMRPLDRGGQGVGEGSSKEPMRRWSLFFESFETSMSFRPFDVFALGRGLIGQRQQQQQQHQEDGGRVGGWMDAKE
jgi:hypothetical protein